MHGVTVTHDEKRAPASSSDISPSMAPMGGARSGHDDTVCGASGGSWYSDEKKPASSPPLPDELGARLMRASKRFTVARKWAAPAQPGKFSGNLALPRASAGETML